MANVVRDPKEHPDAIIPDLSKADPAIVTFTKDAIAFVYGSKWKQRYFTKVGDDYFPLPAQWDVANQTWSRYFVRDGTDWWVPHYPADNMQRPTGPLCDGCHSVNYNIQTKTVTEWNVGCEKCHGPGSLHVARPSRANIVNPARLGSRGSDVCIQCHSQGQPLANPIQGKYYDWPVGFCNDATKKLSDFWQLEDHKLGETTFTHFPDGTGHKNRMQGNDFVQSLMYSPRRHLFHLPRRARHREQRRPDPAGQCAVPAMPRPEFSQRSAHRDHRAAHPSSRRIRRQRVRELPHAQDRAGDRQHQRPQPHLQVHRPARSRAPEDAQLLHILSHRRDRGVGQQDAQDVDRVLALARRELVSTG